MVIEAEDVEDFKIFVRALCFWAPPNGFCRRFITSCKSCLQENEITIVDPHIAPLYMKKKIAPIMTKKDIK